MQSHNYETIDIIHKKTQLIFLLDEQHHIYLLYAGEIRKDAVYLESILPQLSAFPITQLHITGDNIHHKGIKLSNSETNESLIYKDYTDIKTVEGRLITINEYNPVHEISVTTFFQMYDSTSCIRTWKKIKQMGTGTTGIEWLSSFSYTGILQQDDYPGNYAEHMELHVAHNAWTSELQWQRQTLKELGLNYRVDGEHKQPSSKRISITNQSSWSCSEYSPNGILYNNHTNQTAAWQIEHNGAWHYEIGDTGSGDIIYLNLLGPEEYDNQCWIKLCSGESFETVPVAFVQTEGSVETAIIEMNRYRRLIRRPSNDNKRLPVIFNDYMNCLMGEPSTEIEKPLIAAAAKAGCEYFVIDCGWYADGYWWDSVGEWIPSEKRFPNGIEELIHYIRSYGMIPGLWLEIEVMGIHCPLADQLPDNWFFMRHGKRIIDVDRYHLDFRNPDVSAYADKILDRLIRDYGVGYIKMDYNITTGIGSDVASDSCGEGLLSHNRAYLAWLDRLFERYPDLVIENCGSGGMRHDYAMLSRHSIQSLSDQTDYIRNATIAAAGATAITPEQCAVWSYPLEKGDEEEVIYNMMNAMLLRIHQSGYLNRLTEQRFQLVKEGIDIYKKIRKYIPATDPVWPTGIPHIDDDVHSFGLIYKKTLLLAVWNNTTASNIVHIEFSAYGNVKCIQQIYPSNKRYNISIDHSRNDAYFKFQQAPCARLFQITLD